MTTWTPIAQPGGQNLITNPTFSSNGANWTQTVGTWAFTSGAKCTVNPGIGQLDSVPLSFNLGTTYTMVVTVTGRTQGQLVILASEGFVSITTNGTTQFTWTQSATTETVAVNLIADSGPDFDGTITSVLIAVGTAVGASWSTIPYPTGTTSITTGFAYGLLMAITRPVTTNSDNWTRIGAPSTTWTNIPTP